VIRLDSRIAMLRASINRTPYELPEGCSLLDALRAAGVRLPALCHTTA
jgi:NADH dehydrogenase/NADH:ubiquinone oxidoreductase subunit G